MDENYAIHSSCTNLSFMLFFFMFGTLSHEGFWDFGNFLLLNTFSSGIPLSGISVISLWARVMFVVGKIGHLSFSHALRKRVFTGVRF